MHIPENRLIHKPYTVDEEGNVSFCLYYPKAKSVRIIFFDTEPQFLKLEQEGHYWAGTVTATPGPHGLIVQIDGSRVLNDALPIGFAYSRPCNHVVVPDPEVPINMDVPHGSVVADYFQSKVTGKLERILVYLPPNYHSSDERFPVLYLQHGHGEQAQNWVDQGDVNFIADSLIAEGKAVPTIVVMCDGMVSEKEEGGTHLNFTEGFEQLMVDEVIPFIDGRYRTVPDENYRAMAGLSMGSIQTSILTLKHQDLFRYVGLFSGFLQDILSGYEEHLKPELLKKYRRNCKVYFRGIGKDDHYREHFESDSELLKEHKVFSTVRYYDGGHLWGVWRHCFYDFYQMLFWDCYKL